MADKTDARLKSLEKQIKSTYTKAYTEMKEEASKLWAKMQSNPNMPMAQKMALMAKHDRLTTLTQQLTDTVSNANAMAERMINGEMVNVYEINYNESAKELGFSVVDHGAVKKILTQEENPFNKINALHDKTAIKHKMQGELMTGLLKGESMDKIATRLKNVSEGNLKNAIRVARTETTRVQNSAKMDIGKHGEELGFVMMKRWMATHDGRVRDDHIAMNGVEVEQDEPFVLPDGTKMLFPCDISLGADAGQVINCRCTVVEFIKRDENGNLVMKGEEDEYEKTGMRHTTQIAQGKDISTTFKRRPDEFDFEIEDAINQQGFDGKPRIVGEEEFDKLVEESGFIAQRTYSADSEELLEAYREQLYNGEWYVDCSTGGAQYGQGMYCAADYTGTISEGIEREMQHYQYLNESRGNPFAYTETFTLDRDAKIVTYSDLLEEFGEYKTDVSSSAVVDYIEGLDKSDDFIIAMKGQMGVKGVEFDDAFSAYGRLSKEERQSMSEFLAEARTIERDASLQALNMNIGSFATLRGYDAINASGHGESGSYTVILNRTKVIFKKP